MDSLQRKINAFKDKFKDLIKMGFPSSWDANGQFISQKNYLEFILAQKNEDSKFKEMNKSLTRQILIGRISDDFNILE